MKVELYLNPDAAGYADFLEDMKEELSALKGLKYSEETAPAPPKTLTVEHDVLKFIFEHGGDALQLSIVLLQVIHAALERHHDKHPQKREAEERPIVVLQVGDQRLKYPASDKAERNFVERLKKGKRQTRKPNKRRSARKSRKKR